jgi:glucokinase
VSAAPAGSAAPGAPAVLAVDVGGTGIKAAVLDGAGTALRVSELVTPVADGPDAVVDVVRAVALDLTGPDVVAAGVVVPGAVDVASGTARYAANIGWHDVPLRDLIAADLGVPVALEHDVRAAGLAEQTLGCAQGVADCLIVIIGTGIAGVIVSGGVALRGAIDLAGEIGHVPVYPDGDLCACGQRGCLETYASAGAIARRYRALGGDVSPGADPSSARDVVALRASDPRAAQVWDEAAQAMGIALASYTMLLDPSLVVLGGGLSAAGEALLDPVRAALAARLVWRPVPAVELSPLGSGAGQLGAAILAWQAAG